MPPKKKPRKNISGLKNQKNSPSAAQVQPMKPTPPVPTIQTELENLDDPPISDEELEDAIFERTTHFDGLRVDWWKEDESDHPSDDDSELETDDDFEFDDEDGLTSMINLAKELNEKEDDLEWLPPRQARKRKNRKGSRIIICRLMEKADWK